MDIDTDIQENACGDRGRDYSGVSAKQDCWWPPEAEGGRKDPRRVFRGSTALPTLDVWMSGLQNWEATHVCCFKPLSLWSFARQPRKRTQQVSWASKGGSLTDVQVALGLPLNSQILLSASSLQDQPHLK